MLPAATSCTRVHSVTLDLVYALHSHVRAPAVRIDPEHTSSESDRQALKRIQSQRTVNAPRLRDPRRGSHSVLAPDIAVELLRVRMFVPGCYALTLLYFASRLLNSDFRLVACSLYI